MLIIIIEDTGLVQEIRGLGHPPQKFTCRPTNPLIWSMYCWHDLWGIDPSLDNCDVKCKMVSHMKKCERPGLGHDKWQKSCCKFERCKSIRKYPNFIWNTIGYFSIFPGFLTSWRHLLWKREIANPIPRGVDGGLDSACFGPGGELAASPPFSEINAPSFFFSPTCSSSDPSSLFLLLPMASLLWICSTEGISWLFTSSKLLFALSVLSLLPAAFSPLGESNGLRSLRWSHTCEHLSRCLLT